MKSVVHILKSFEGWLFRHSHYVVPTDEENNITSNPMVDNHIHRYDDDDVDDDDLYPLEECVFSLPRGTVVQGWKKVHFANPMSNNQFECLVPELKGLVHVSGLLPPTNTALILTKCLRVDVRKVQDRYFALSQPVIPLEVMDTVMIAKGKRLNPLAVIDGYGIVIDGNVPLVGDSPDAYHKTTTGSNKVVIPPGVLNVLYDYNTRSTIEYTGLYGDVNIRKVGW